MILKTKSPTTGRYIAYDIAKDRANRQGLDGETLRRYGRHVGYQDEEGVWRDKYHEPLTALYQYHCSWAKVVE